MWTNLINLNDKSQFGLTKHGLHAILAVEAKKARAGLRKRLAILTFPLKKPQKRFFFPALRKGGILRFFLF